MKPRRFVTEYANYKIEQISRESSFSEEEKTEKIRRIDRTVRMYELGMLTVDETMNTINVQ